jgi:acyl-CoA thioesterase FadM
VEKLPAARVHIDHIITSKERKVIIAEGYVELAFINRETMKLSRAPKFFISAIESHYR